jgi:hypothetical protein
MRPGSLKVHLRRQSNQARVANKVAVVDFALKDGTKTPGQVCNSILLSASPAAMILFCVGVRPLGGGKDLWKRKKTKRSLVLLQRRISLTLEQGLVCVVKKGSLDLGVM